MDRMAKSYATQRISHGPAPPIPPIFWGPVETEQWGTILLRTSRERGVVMAKMKKTTRIAREKNRLLEIFADLDENKLRTCYALIDRAAYITISLQDLEEELNETGWVETYQNGENQTGRKKAAAADVHISLTKNLNAIMKQLLEFVPPAQKASRLQAMMNG